MSSITHLDSVSQLSSILSKSKDKVSVIDFHASWCGPCHAIAPVFEALAISYNKQMNFMKCDVDHAKDVASMYGITAMPTFIFLRGNQKIHQIRGAQRRELEECVRKYATGGEASGAFAGSGRTLGGATGQVDPSREVKRAADSMAAKFSNLDPQLRVLLCLVAGYLAFWYLSQ